MEIQKPKLQDVTACLKKELACLEPLLTRREGLRFTLSAHSALSENLNRTQLLKSLENENWRVKHEVLTRWAWCRAQHDAIAQGQSFNRPFRCEVGSHEQRQTLDREFWCLLRFLPHYAQATCRFPLFLEYRGNTHSSPDFDLEVEGGRLGLEITEADGGRSGDFRLAERVEEGLCKLFSRPSYHLTIWQRPTWQSMLDRWQDLKTWLGSLRPGCPERWPTDPSLEVELKECGQTGFELVDCSEDQGDGRGWIGDEVQRQIARSVVNRLEKKVGGSKLVTQPSILLIHAKLPLTPRLGSARDIILEGGNQELVSKIRDRFQQVWLMTEDEVTEI